MRRSHPHMVWKSVLTWALRCGAQAATEHLQQITFLNHDNQDTHFCVIYLERTNAIKWIVNSAIIELCEKATEASQKSTIISLLTCNLKRERETVVQVRLVVRECKIKLRETGCETRPDPSFHFLF